LADNASFNPETFGIDYYAGLLSGGVRSYTSWDFTEDGVNTTETQYVTEKLTDLSIDWIDQQTKPWFLWLAYNAPHTPFHVPPAEMHSQGALDASDAAISANPLPYFLAAIEAMDYQIGRLLDGMTQNELDNTVIIFIGDNGSPDQVVQTPYSRRRAKGSIYQGGVNVAMIISGTPVTRSGTDETLINGTDLYATIASIAGVNTTKIHDSRNFRSLFVAPSVDSRAHIYAENEDSWCIKDTQYKLLVLTDGSQEFYDLLNDPYETMDLLQGGLSADEETVRSALESAAASIRN